jgi:hypothetical protein
MIIPIEDRDEVLVIDSSKDLMNELRAAILQEFPRTWVFVHHDLIDDMYGIEVANVWGGRLPTEREELIREYIEKFVIDRKDFD